jgi:hypothetical protein
MNRQYKKIHFRETFLFVLVKAVYGLAHCYSVHNSKIGVGHGPVDIAPGCCKVALGSNPQPSTPKLGSSKVDEQPTAPPKFVDE